MTLFSIFSLSISNLEASVITHLTWGVGSRGGRAPWIFIHGTDKVERDFMMLFFGLFFSLAPFPWNLSADALVITIQNRLLVGYTKINADCSHYYDTFTGDWAIVFILSLFS